MTNDKLLEIIERNYDSDTGDLDNNAIVEEILVILKVKERYTIGYVENPFDNLEDDTM
jgi:Holliday junction resolvase-like predicted endonuclease